MPIDPAILEKLRPIAAKAKRVVALTGAGVSAESGIPTFRGAGGLWRQYEATDLANPRAWDRDPGLVWEFYDYRRKRMRDARPNPAHYALATLERRLADDMRHFDLITQNIDDLHLDAGSQRVTRLHGSIWQTRCCRCFDIRVNRDVPITASFEGAGDPATAGEQQQQTRFEAADLPHCEIDMCHGVLRPNVVWFGEMLDHKDLEAAARASVAAHLFLVIGTSSVVYPAAQYSMLAKERGATVIEINPEATVASTAFDYAIQAKAGEALPELVDALFPASR